MRRKTNIISILKEYTNCYNYIYNINNEKRYIEYGEMCIDLYGEIYIDTVGVISFEEIKCLLRDKKLDKLLPLQSSGVSLPLTVTLNENRKK